MAYRINIILFTLISLFIIKTKAQNYNPFPESNSYWTVIEYFNDRVVLFSVEGDTLVNNVPYKKVYKLIKAENGIDTVSNLHCLMRQEIDQKKIYTIRSYLNEVDEKLAYNFNVNFGDTIILTAYDYNKIGDSIFVVNQSIIADSIQLYNGEYRKMFAVNSLSTNFDLLVIEGIGAMNSPFPNQDDWDGLHSNLLTCHEVNFEYVFVNYFENYYDPESSCGFDLIDGISDLEKNPIYYFPNPAFNRVSIIIPSIHFDSDIVVSVYSFGGFLIDEYKYTNLKTEKINLDLEDLSAGIYFITLKSNNLTQYVDKLIINK